MTEVIKVALNGKAPAWLALLSSLLTAVYTAGYQKAQVESLERDRDRLERQLETQGRQIRGLYGHIRRLSDWPARSTRGSTRTDAQ